MALLCAILQSFACFPFLGTSPQTTVSFIILDNLKVSWKLTSILASYIAWLLAVRSVTSVTCNRFTAKFSPHTNCGDYGQSSYFEEVSTSA